MKTVTFLESFPAVVLKSEIDENFVVSQISLVYNRDLSKPSLKIRTASAIFWNDLGIFRD